MHKLTIFFFRQDFNQQDWQKFMGLAEKMPGLRRETVSEINDVVYGGTGRNIERIHEFYFDSRPALDAALQSKEGQAAGAWLHEFTFRRFTMLISEHKEAFQNEFVQDKEENAGTTTLKAE